MPIFNYNDSILNYEVIGKGEPVVFLHGWGHDLGAFRRVVEALKRVYCCYLIDLPGFGSSTKPPPSWDSKDYAELIRDFVTEIKSDGISLVGHSFGGKIAALTASVFPEKINRVILIDSSGIRAPVTFSKLFRIYLFKFSKFIKNSGIFFKLGDWFYDRIERFSGSADYLNAGEMREILKNIVRENIIIELGNLSCPTLILWGEKDTATPLKDAYKMRELIPDSKLITFPDRGHHLPLESPQQVAHHIKEFIG